ncbi:hypothetical protein H6F76_22500 [Leptolyngbya sp. FACHB-321]|uniref:hypothetical protein n=1 Tax=Leptolyngbya sp. FACHB-321 TaxID=2692807 RepID=UPI001683139F|nr:hypothetical protein [Leptolyngbya sp. FACHB-321]MBD2037728.1 hypothetical protein [Leptolyngbya sp. FACHB-321]
MSLPVARTWAKQREEKKGAALCPMAQGKSAEADDLSLIREGHFADDVPSRLSQTAVYIGKEHF